MSNARPIDQEHNIDGLAKVSGVTVRNIRAYRAKGLLQAPERRGRQSIYSTAHITRLRTIKALLERGYTMANIEELLNAWSLGKDLGGVLGLDRLTLPDASPPQEAPEYFSLRDLRNGYGAQLTPTVIKKIVRLRLLVPRGKGFLATRPNLIRIGIELTRIGVPLGKIVDILADFMRLVDVVTGTVVDALDADLPSSQATANVAHVTQTSWELRALLDQAITLELTESMHRSLEERFGTGMDRRRSERRAAGKPTKRSSRGSA